MLPTGWRTWSWTNHQICFWKKIYIHQIQLWHLIFLYIHKRWATITWPRLAMLSVPRDGVDTCTGIGCGVVTGSVERTAVTWPTVVFLTSALVTAAARRTNCRRDKRVTNWPNIPYLLFLWMLKMWNGAVWTRVNLQGQKGQMLLKNKKRDFNGWHVSKASLKALHIVLLDLCQGF